MPIALEPDAREQWSLAEAISALEEARLDARDADALAAHAPLLKCLANNQRFLADVAVAELETRCSGQMRHNGYGAQVVMLHRGPGWFMRANFWPAASDSAVRVNGPAAFFYGVPHDHNFNFLTVGYHGPGYWSDYWEVDGDAIEGRVGEPVALRPCGRRRLGEGEMMLYRRSIDVHSQLPADSLSVSLNLVESNPGTRWRDQYRFDVDAGCVAGMLSDVPLEPLLTLAAALGGGNGAELLGETARRHPSDRIRARAVSLLGQWQPDGWGDAVVQALHSPPGLARHAAEAALTASPA